MINIVDRDVKLDNNKIYKIVYSINFNDSDVYYLINIDDFSDMKFCYLIDDSTFEEIRNIEELRQVVARLSKGAAIFLK